MATLLSKERTIAKPGFNQWLIPPCALATHLCIGQAYAISVFNLPLELMLIAMSFMLGALSGIPETYASRFRNQSNADLYAAFTLFVMFFTMHSYKQTQ